MGKPHNGLFQNKGTPKMASGVLFGVPLKPTKRGALKAKDTLMRVWLKNRERPKMEPSTEPTFVKFWE